MNEATEILAQPALYTDTTLLGFGIIAAVTIIAILATSIVMRREMKSMTNRQFRRWKAK